MPNIENQGNIAIEASQDTGETGPVPVQSTRKKGPNDAIKTYRDPAATSKASVNTNLRRNIGGEFRAAGLAFIATKLSCLL